MRVCGQKSGKISPAASLFENLFTVHHCLDICLRISDAFDIKSFNKYFCNIGRKKRRKRWTEPEIFESEMQQCQQYSNRFLLIPGYIKGYGQFIDIFDTKNFLELQSYDRKGLAIVTLSGILKNLLYHSFFYNFF